MKLILDLDEKTIENMQGYCSLHGITTDELVTNLFNRYIQEPAEIIDKHGIEDLNRFLKLLTQYMNEAILDIEGSANSEESYETDNVMIDVFKKLNRNHLGKAEVLTDLYRVYKNI